MIRCENNPLEAMKTSFLQSGHNGFFVKGLTYDLVGNWSVFLYCQKKVLERKYGDIGGVK